KYASGAPDFTYPIVNKTNTYSAYLSDVINLTEQFSFLAALRLNHFKTNGGNVGGPAEAYSQTNLSPKFGLVYQAIKDNLSIFANYQNAFINNGTYNAYDSANPGTPIALNAQPEQANQFEAGIKVDAAQGRISGTISYYNIRVDNMLRADNRAPLIA